MNLKFLFSITEATIMENVWTDAKSSEEKPPVLVWLYGFTSGKSGASIYDGEAISQ
ncbi:carboxylesterase type B [Catalinimonas alkaloidigena]|uniref:hypothetical protein n=1 Tax=Catalinimonas alkaloidigena TaxID=1075417 RepID=UPI002405E5ED|nr:hypothetical protein [Catalinimonas alkaloidigena]MDF9800479.1 carboxylesterase type B [Catalinimonas alkaloidigena]